MRPGLRGDPRACGRAGRNFPSQPGRPGRGPGAVVSLRHALAHAHAHAHTRALEGRPARASGSRRVQVLLALRGRGSRRHVTAALTRPRSGGGTCSASPRGPAGPVAGARAGSSPATRPSGVSWRTAWAEGRTGTATSLPPPAFAAVSASASPVSTAARAWGGSACDLSQFLQRGISTRPGRDRPQASESPSQLLTERGKRENRADTRPEGGAGCTFLGFGG